MCVLLFAMVFTAYAVYGNTVVSVTYYDIRSGKIPPEFDGFCIVLISDFHNSGNAVMTDSLIDKVKKANPDIILLTGDIIDCRTTDVDTGIALIEKISEIAPAYFVMGNHEARTGDYYALSKAMRKMGVTELNNAYVNIRLNDDEIVIAGICDPMTSHDKGIPDSVITNEQLSSLGYDRGYYTVLLSHRPEQLRVYAANDVDLVFTGHAHGGLINIPLIGGLYAPHQGLFPDYYGGLYKRGTTDMIVSRGVGNSGHSFRINNNPELVVAVLHVD